MQQRDIGRFIIKTNVKDLVSIATQGGWFAVNAYQARTVLSQSPLFGDLAKVFDQFKINAIRVRVVPVDYESVAGANLESCIAWDRNGPVALENLTFVKLASYGSAKLNYYSQGSKTIQTHWIGAETIGEKTSYIPTATPLAQAPALWDPHFLIGIQGPLELGEGQSYTLNCAMEWTFDITFRGTRSQ